MTLAPTGVIGVGLMGEGMATFLRAAGHRVTVLAHQDRGPVVRSAKRGAHEAADATDFLQASHVLITCLPDAVEVVAERIRPRLLVGQIRIETITLRPDTSEWLTQHLAERDAVFADAHFPIAETVFDTYSTTVRRFGTPCRGHAAKLLNNLVTQGAILLLADAYQAACKLGADAQARLRRDDDRRDPLLPARQGGWSSARGDSTGAQFSIATATKGLRYMRDLLGLVDPSPADFAETLTERLQILVRQGHGDDFVSHMLKPETA